MMNLRLDYVIEETLRLSAQSVEQQALRELAGVKLDESQAARVWARIREHKWYISERMGRDVGLRVAAIDFFENIEPQLTLKRRRRDGLPPRLRMMQSLSS